MSLTVGDGMYEYRYGYEHDYKINKAKNIHINYTGSIL